MVIIPLFEKGRTTRGLLTYVNLWHFEFAIVAHDWIDRSARRGAIKWIVSQILDDDRVYTIKSKTGW